MLEVILQWNKSRGIVTLPKEWIVDRAQILGLNMFTISTGAMKSHIKSSKSLTILL